MIAVMIILGAMVGWEYTTVATCWSWTSSNGPWKTVFVFFGGLAGSSLTITLLMTEKEENLVRSLFAIAAYVILAQTTDTLSNNI